MERIVLKPIDRQVFRVRVEGTTPLITHKMSEKARKQMRDKKMGIKTRARERCNPDEECENSHYRLSDGSLGIPVTAFKNAIESAAHKDMGIPKTLVSRGMYIKADEWHKDCQPLVRIDTNGWRMREDVVRVASGAADLRYRPEHTKWSAELEIEFDAEILVPETIVNLLARAGFGIGIGDWRVEKHGEFGRFRVVPDESSDENAQADKPRSRKKAR